jgi:chaperonin cofactor prefoldin
VENIMAKKSEETAQPKKVARESDNPIVEEYKEELLNKPGYAIYHAADYEARICRLERQMAEVQEKLEDLERRIRPIN